MAFLLSLVILLDLGEPLTGIEGVVIKGAIKDYNSGQRITNYSVIAINADDASNVVTGVIDENGLYTLRLCDPGVFLLKISADQYFLKTSVLNLTGMDHEEWHSGCAIRVDASLFPKIDIDPIEPFIAPAAFLDFDYSIREFVWDYEYIELQRECQLKAMKLHSTR